MAQTLFASHRFIRSSIGFTDCFNQSTSFSLCIVLEGKKVTEIIAQCAGMRELGKLKILTMD